MLSTGQRLFGRGHVRRQPVEGFVVGRVLADERAGRGRTLGLPFWRPLGPAQEFDVDGTVLRRDRPGVRGPAHDHAGQRGHAQPVGLASQADVHAEPGLPGAGTQAGQPAPTGAAARRHQRHQPGRLRGVLQVRGSGRRVPAQPDGVLRGQPVRQSIRVAAPWRLGAHRFRKPDGRDSGVRPLRPRLRW